MINRRKSPRRQHSRAKVSWPAVVVSKHATIQGKVENLSRGGAFLYLEEAVEVDESIRIAIEIPEYNDVISTVGKVVRLFPLDPKIEKYSCGVGIKFTDLSAEDLRFFTGNLAPEWEKNYQEPARPFQFSQILTRGTGYILLATVALVLTIFAFRSFNQNKIDPSQIVALETRLKNIESQLENLSEMTASNGKVKDQILDIRSEISSLQNEFATMTVVEKLQERINSNVQQLADKIPSVTDKVPPVADKIPSVTDKVPSVADKISSATDRVPTVTIRVPTVSEDSLGLSEPEPLISPDPEPAQPPTDIQASKKKTKLSVPVSHMVKKDENLYRIGLMYGIDVDTLRKLNKLSDKDSIQPGQKLLVR